MTLPLKKPLIRKRAFTPRNLNLFPIESSYFTNFEPHFFLTFDLPPEFYFISWVGRFCDEILFCYHKCFKLFFKLSAVKVNVVKCDKFFIVSEKAMVSIIILIVSLRNRLSDL